jgi:ribosomal protein S27E
MKVSASVDYTELENDSGNFIDGVTVTCERCGHQTESFGTSDSSVRRCLVLLREECPEGENNFYVTDDEAE